nr:putative disease resistance protein rga1 [Quercus suber]
MAEAIVTDVAKEILSKVIPLVTEQINLVWGFKDELTRLRQSVEMIQDVLADAERKQVTDLSVKRWLQTLKDLAYDADDVLDELAYEILRRKVEIRNQMKRKVCFFFSFSNPIAFRIKMANKVKTISESLKKSNEEANGFGLTREKLVNANPEIIPNRETDSSVDHSEIIEELGRLNQLKGKLDIRRLEHVKDKEASKNAKLVEKAKVYELGFYWSEDREGNHNNDEEVLEGLQPHRYLKSLTIVGFGGEKFPSWMLTSHDARDGFLLYDNLINIKLIGCKKCEFLPPLGLLPCLRDLYISGMDNVRSIGTEFYGNYNDGGYDKILFPCLKSLLLWFMRNLVEWTDAMEPTTTGTVFPCLKNLTIKFCEQLKSAPCHFPSLEKLNISQTNSTTFEKISSKLTTLTSLEIWGISELASLPEQLLKNNSSLMSLEVWSCDDLVSLSPHGDVWGFYTSLRSLQISNCEKLSYLPDGLHTLRSLENFEIRNCPNLRSFPSIKGVALLLRSLAISCSDEVLPTGLESCISLSSLEINECPKLISIPNLQDLHSLSSLTITSCKRLMGLPDGLDCLTRLKYLSIGGFCEELDVFPSLSSIQHASLETLELVGWAKLNSLPDDIQRFTALTELWIWNFDQMEALPEWLGNLSSVQKLHLWECMNLISGWIKRKKESSLQELQMIKIQGPLTKLEKLKIFLVKVIQKQCEDSSPFLPWFSISQTLTPMHILRLSFSLQDLNFGYKNAAFWEQRKRTNPLLKRFSLEFFRVVDSSFIKIKWLENLFSLQHLVLIWMQVDAMDWLTKLHYLFFHNSLKIEFARVVGQPFLSSTFCTYLDARTIFIWPKVEAIGSCLKFTHILSQQCVSKLYYIQLEEHLINFMEFNRSSSKLHLEVYVISGKAGGRRGTFNLCPLMCEQVWVLQLSNSLSCEGKGREKMEYEISC